MIFGRVRILALLLLLTSIAARSAGQDFFLQREQIPIDSGLIHGKLENGFSYYLKKTNSTRIHLQFVVKVGAVHESPNQVEFSHLLEHLAARGTKTYKGLKYFILSKGLVFGNDFNAVTWPDNTTYQITIPAGDSILLDQCLKIIRDWAAGDVDFSKKAIESERGIVLQEITMNSSLEDSIRLASSVGPGDACNLYFRKRSDRINSVKNLKVKAIKQFCRDWYRPGIEAIFVVGNVNQRIVEKKILDLYSNIDSDLAYQDIDRRDAVLTGENRYYSLAHESIRQSALKVAFRLPYISEKSLPDLRKRLLAEMYADMFNFRKDSLVEDGIGQTKVCRAAFTPNLFFCGNRVSGMTFDVKYDPFTLQQGLRNLIAEVRRLSKEGFTEHELMLAQQRFISRNTEVFDFSNEMMSDYLEHFRDGNIILDPIRKRHILDSLIRETTISDFHNFSKAIEIDANRDIVILSSIASAEEIPSRLVLEQWLLEAQAIELDSFRFRIVERTASVPLLDTTSISKDQIFSVSGIRQAHIASIDVTTIELPNGIKVLLKPLKDREIFMKAIRKEWDFDLLQDTLLTRYADDLILGSGLGPYDRKSWNQYLDREGVRFGYSVDGQDVSLGGICMQSNGLETMFQALYLALTNPKIDTAFFEDWKKKKLTESQTVNPAINPEIAYKRAISNGSSENYFVTFNALKDLSIEYIYNGYRKLFRNDGEMTVVVCGNYDMALVRKFISKYLSIIPRAGTDSKGKGKLESCVGDGTVMQFFKNYKNNGDYVNLRFTCDLPYSPGILLRMEILRRQIEASILFRLRDKEALSYSPIVYIGTRKCDEGEYYQIGITFDCSRGRAFDAVNCVRDEFRRLGQGFSAGEDFESIKQRGIVSLNGHLIDPNYWGNYLVRQVLDGKNIEDISLYDQVIETTSASTIREMVKCFDIERYQFFLLGTGAVE